MVTGMIGTKLVVNDLAAAEAFYCALGLQPVSRNLGGEAEVRQDQVWLSATGAPGAHILILTRFVELPAQPRPVYPGEVWLAMQVEDVTATENTVTAAGGSIIRAGQDRPEHHVRAAVVADPEGHLIEIVGPLAGG